MSVSTSETVAPVPAPVPRADLRETPRERWIRRAERRGPLVVLVLVCVAATIASPSFASWSDISTILGGSAFVWLLALGMTFVITTGGIDLSVGSLYALGGVLAARGAASGSWAAILLPLARVRRVGHGAGPADRVRQDGAVHRHAGRAARRPRPAAGDHEPGFDDVPGAAELVVPAPGRGHLDTGRHRRGAVRGGLGADGAHGVRRETDRHRRQRELGGAARPARGENQGIGIHALRHPRRRGGRAGRGAPAAPA